MRLCKCDCIRTVRQTAWLFIGTDKQCFVWKMASPNSIKDYYAGATVLVTGGSGFLGKAIIEKLLRTCTEVRTVYTLMRSKRGVSSEDRLEKLKNNQVRRLDKCFVWWWFLRKLFVDFRLDPSWAAGCHEQVARSDGRHFRRSFGPELIGFRTVAEHGEHCHPFGGDGSI